MDHDTGQVTRLLGELRAGKPDAEAQLFGLVYAELRRIAAIHLSHERLGHTLQPTALVHEAYLRLVEQPQQNWQNRAHFIGVGARLMRQILIDHARKRLAVKRGGDVEVTTLEEVALPRIHDFEELLALDEALSRLESMDKRQSRIVELRFFGGLTEEEVSQVLGISVRTIKRDWNVARAWLYDEITK